jgi:hypothetical protein
MSKKHALIIGIDQYSNFEERYQLRGCVNDAKLMRGILVDHFKFDESDIVTLHNAQANQKGILDAMENLLKQVQQDDIVVFHFSGHGSQRKAADLSEGTGMNSTITPADSGYMDPYPNLDIIDNTINEWLMRLSSKTRYISLTFDCCHSGTITRDAFAARARGLPNDTRSLAAMGIDASKLPTATRGNSNSQKTKGWLALNDNYVVMSGCRDDEYSYEFEAEGGAEPIRNGALTHFLSKALLSAKPGSTYRDVFELARHGVNSKFKAQHPQIEGAQDREIFGVNDVEPLRFIAVESLDDTTVTLAGGSAHGLCINSLWAIYPQGTKKLEGLTPLAKIEITEVGSLSAQAEIREGDRNFGPGARCIEIATAAEQFLLSVDLSQVEASLSDELAEQVRASRLLTITHTAGAGDARVFILEPDAKDFKGLSLPSNLSIEAPTWVVVDPAGELAMPLHSLGDENSIKIIVSNLEAMARYRNALRLDNPDSQLKVEFNIFHVDANGDLHNINGEDFVFEEGQNLAFEIVNNEPNNVFVSLLDFGLTGKISLFYPPRSTSEMIAPGKSIRIGADARKIKLSVLPEFTGDQGTETVKAMITSDEADFRWLQQEGTRSLEGKRSSLRQQFEAAYNGPPTRNMSFESEENNDGDWKAIARSFELRRRSV